MLWQEETQVWKLMQHLIFFPVFQLQLNNTKKINTLLTLCWNLVHYFSVWTSLAFWEQFMVVWAFQIHPEEKFPWIAWSFGFMLRQTEESGCKKLWCWWNISKTRGSKGTPQFASACFYNTTHFTSVTFLWG